MGEKREREENATLIQKEMIVDFMESEPSIVKNRADSVEGRDKLKNLWAVLCEQLNSVGPAKTVNKWQRVWTDMKSKCRKKASEFKKYRGGTGGGPPSQKIITDLEWRIVKLLTEESIFGLQGPDNVSLDSAAIKPAAVQIAAIQPFPASTSQPEPTLPEPSCSYTVSDEINVQPIVMSEDEMSVPSSMPSTPSTSRSSTPTRRQQKKRTQSGTEIMQGTQNNLEKIISQNEEITKKLDELVNVVRQNGEERNTFLNRIAVALERLAK